MEGQADDYVIDERGELVKPGEAILHVLDEGTVVAVVMQSDDGDLAVQIYGPPSKELIAALYTAIRGLMVLMKDA